VQLKQLKFEAVEKGGALENGEVRTWFTADMTKKVAMVGG